MSQSLVSQFFSYFFFFNDMPTTEIYTLSLHDALPIFCTNALMPSAFCCNWPANTSSTCLAASRSFKSRHNIAATALRSEEHTSELQSRFDLVCRLLLEKKKKKHPTTKDSNNKLIHLHFVAYYVSVLGFSVF